MCIVVFVVVFVFILNIFNQMFNIGDTGMEEMKAISGKISVTVDQRLDTTVGWRG